MNSWVFITFLLYFLVLIAIGAVAYRRTSDLADYILGGRRLGSWVSAFSAQASDMSGWLLMGLPGLAYTKGLQASWMVLGLIGGTYLNWKFVAAPLRTSTYTYDDSLTIPVFFERRFNDETRLLRLTSASVILLFFTFYTSSGLVAGAKLFESVFEIPYRTALTAGTAAILLYTLIGGFIAVSWTDLIQGILMVSALVAVALMGLWLVGGPAAMATRYTGDHAALLSPLTDATGQSLGWISILSLLGWGLGYFGQPHILARFMAIKSKFRVPFARRIAVTWVITCLVAAVLAGMLGLQLLDDPLSGAETEKVFIHLTEFLLHPAVAGVVLAAILAAIMSTADSQLLVASAAVAEDLYSGFLNNNASRRKLLWVGRLAVIGISLTAYAIA
ncbi:MAG: sodium/proline symporter, partial [bacterium]